MAQEALTRPGYEKVTVRGVASSASNLARSDADYVLTVMPEELTVPNLKLLGPVPAALGLRIDLAAASSPRRPIPSWRGNSWPIW